MARIPALAQLSTSARAFALVRTLLAAAIVIGSVAWATDLYRRVGLVLFTEQFAAAMLAVAFLLLFMAVPARRNAEPGIPPWYDVILGLAGFCAAGYVALRYENLGTMMVFHPADGLIAAAALIVLSLEGVRRTVGWPLVIVVLCFLAYGLWGHLIPGTLAARPSQPMQLIYYLGFDSNAILGTPIIVACTIVIAFVLFGNLLMATGGGEFFNDISLAAMGRYRGGSAKITIASSALFGTISGSAVANVVSSGVVTIPMMIRSGYPPHKAAAIEAVSSTGGSLMPPVMGAAAFVMAEYLQISYAEVMIVATVPAILYFAVLLIVADLEAARAGITRVAEAEIPRARDVLRDGWHFALSFVVMIYTLFWLNMQPDESALYSSLTLIVTASIFGYRGQRPTVARVFTAVRDTGLAVLDLIMITVGAGVVIGILSVSGLGFGLTLALVTFAKHNLILLLVLAALVSIVLGMGMPTVAVYVLLAALVAPAMVESGVLPVAAHLFVLYFGMMSFVTPPVAIAAFAAAGLAKADPFRTGFESMRFGWVAYIVPFLFVYSPTLILIGHPLAIVVDFCTALVGIWLISAGMVGFALRRLNVAERAVFIAAGAMLLLPISMFPLAGYVNLAGVALAAMLLVRENVLRTRARRAMASAE
ncbi:MAG: TRAP transporter fused permease subunit [Proteobacteria bacterium]|nr:TRAP transporter fused permease subunit [Pseudomonadota bacterium]